MCVWRNSNGRWISLAFISWVLTTFFIFLLLDERSSNITNSERKDLSKYLDNLNVSRRLTFNKVSESNEILLELRKNSKNLEDISSNLNQLKSTILQVLGGNRNNGQPKDGFGASDKKIVKEVGYNAKYR